MRYQNYYKVTDPEGNLRFASVYLEEAVDWVNVIYKRTSKPKDGVMGTICSINECKVNPQ